MNAETICLSLVVVVSKQSAVPFRTECAMECQWNVNGMSRQRKEATLCATAVLQVVVVASASSTR
jgi:hypothetical protein